MLVPFSAKLLWSWAWKHGSWASLASQLFCVGTAVVVRCVVQHGSDTLVLSMQGWLSQTCHMSAPSKVSPSKMHICQRYHMYPLMGARSGQRLVESQVHLLHWLVLPRLSPRSSMLHREPCGARQKKTSVQHLVRECCEALMLLSHEHMPPLCPYKPSEEDCVFKPEILMDTTDQWFVIMHAQHRDISTPFCSPLVASNAKLLLWSRSTDEHLEIMPADDENLLPPGEAFRFPRGTYPQGVSPAWFNWLELMLYIQSLGTPAK